MFRVSAGAVLDAQCGRRAHVLYTACHGADERAGWHLGHDAAEEGPHGDEHGCGGREQGTGWPGCAVVGRRDGILIGYKLELLALDWDGIGIGIGNGVGIEFEMG